MDSLPDPTASDSNSNSDTESTTSHSIPTQSQPHHIPSHSAQNQIQEQKQSIFPLAHPPPTTSPTHRLRLSPNLLLQIQHLPPESTRPLPVLEAWLPSRFGRLGGSGSGNLPKLRGGDVYITLSEGYTSLSGSHRHDLGGEEEVAGAGTGAGTREGGAVVSVIYNAHGPKTKSKSKKEDGAEAEVHFPLSGRTWSASATASGGYRFQSQSQGGGHVLEWKRRGSGTGTGKGERSRSMSTFFSSSSTDAAAAPGGECRFVLAIVDVKTRREARVASLTKRGFEVGCWERLPREGLLECVLASALSTEGGVGGELSEGQLRTAVYTMILTMGVWVALQEGWLG